MLWFIFLEESKPDSSFIQVTKSPQCSIRSCIDQTILFLKYDGTKRKKLVIEMPQT